jgi:hypothetical protein
MMELPSIENWPYFLLTKERASPKSPDARKAPAETIGLGEAAAAIATSRQKLLMPQKK